MNPLPEDIEKYGSRWITLQNGPHELKCWALPMILVSPVIRAMVESPEKGMAPFNGTIQVPYLNQDEMEDLYHIVTQVINGQPVKTRNKTEFIMAPLWVASSYFQISIKDHRFARAAEGWYASGGQEPIFMRKNDWIEVRLDALHCFEKGNPTLAWEILSKIPDDKRNDYPSFVGGP